VNIESIIEKCKELKLKAMADNLQQTIILAEQKNWSSLQAIDHLFSLEIELRRKTESTVVLNNQSSMKRPPSTSSILIFIIHGKTTRTEF